MSVLAQVTSYLFDVSERDVGEGWIGSRIRA
jgi:hypothetical protein